MIISHQHKFIFIHCRKAAGSSVTVSLARYLGSNDIQIGSFHDLSKENIRPNKKSIINGISYNLGYPFIKRYLRSIDFTGSLNHPIKMKYISKFGYLPEHPPATDIKRVFPSEWDQYYKFCIVRNTYERVVSDYIWRKFLFNKELTFSEFLAAIQNGNSLNGLIPPLSDNWPMYTIKDRVEVDEVIQISNLKGALGKLMPSLGVNWDGWLPRAKQIKTGYDWKSFYTKKTIEQVYSLFSKEIDYFNYRPDSS